MVESLISVIYIIAIFAIVARKVSQAQMKNNARKDANYGRESYEKLKQYGSKVKNKAQEYASGTDLGRVLPNLPHKNQVSGSEDYCDSHMKPSPGISFRGLREGTDELEYLSKFNSARERALEQDMRKQSNG